MSRDVYDPAQQSYRVDFACSVILRGGRNTRKFDTCLEMGDAHMVAARIHKRALSNPALMDALPRYLDVAMCKADYRKYFPEAARAAAPR